MSPCLNSRRRAFTLVELLVVIGIIAVLVGLLLPSLAKARAHAKSVHCGAILRQMGIAFNNYAANNKGWIQTMANTTSGTGFLQIQSYSNTQYTLTGAPPFTVDFNGGYLSKYLGRADVMRNCPSVNERDTNIVGASGGVYDQLPISYAYSPYVVNANAKATGASSTPSATKSSLTLQVSRIRYPVETFFFGDAAAMNSNQLKYLSFAGDWLDMPGNQLRPDGTTYTTAGAQRLHGRHVGKASVMWFDGHVTSETPNYSCTTSTGSNTPALRKALSVGDLMPPGATFGDANQNYYFWRDKVGQF